MAKRQSQSKSPLKGFITGCVATGVAALVYAAVFPLHSLAHYLLMGVGSLLAGYIGYTMGSGLDTSKTAEEIRQPQQTGNPQVDRILEKGGQMMRKIQEENRRIPDPVLTRQMDEIESIAGKIFRVVVEQPEKASQIRRFMDYYLPTTLKILQGYRRLQNQGDQEAAMTRKKIEDAMQVVLVAFRRQRDMLYRNDMLDISTDIDVMETMLKQDDLIEDGLTDVQPIAAAGTAVQMKEEKQ